MFQPSSKLKQIIQYHTLVSLEEKEVKIDLEIPSNIELNKYQLSIHCFVQVSRSLFINLIQTFILRGERNKLYLNFGETTSTLVNAEKKELRIHIKRLSPANHADDTFKAGDRAVYLHDYFGDVFFLCPKVFIQQASIGSHREWHLVHAYLEKQRGKKHVL